MKCKSKVVFVCGIQVENCKTVDFKITKKPLKCIITNDDIGKTLSIDDGQTQFTIPFEPIEQYLK